jgi:hypothetical protein
MEAVMNTPPFRALKRRAGKLAYLRTTDGSSWGFEDWSMTVGEDGRRTLAVHCELQTMDMHVARDIVQSVGADFFPHDASVRLMIDGKWAGHATYRFEQNEVICDGFNAASGVVRQSHPITHPHRGFGTHALQGDAWLCARMDLSRGPHEQIFQGNIMCSDHHLGATGPAIMTTNSGFAYLGLESVSVPAGRFDCHRFRLIGSSIDHPPYDMWLTADGDFIFVKGIVEGYMAAAFELLDLK